MSGMDQREVAERMAAARLRQALEEHIEETEPVPVEVGEAVRGLFGERNS